MPKRTLNVALLKKIKEHILAKPNRFVMRTFVLKSKDYGKEYKDDDWQMRKFDKCGTAACIGGWAVLLHDGINADVSDIRNKAVKVLGLDRERGDDDNYDEDDYDLAGDYLFETSCWPEPFSTNFDTAKTPAARAKVAAKRIDHLIATGE
jgi:hypothetical protein